MVLRTHQKPLSLFCRFDFHFDPQKGDWHAKTLIRKVEKLLFANRDERFMVLMMFAIFPL